MKQRKSTPSSPGLTRWITAIALLAALAVAVVCLAQPPAIAAGGSRAAAAPDFAAIDAYVEAEMQAQRIPGLALGIVQSDQIVHLKGFGVANLLFWDSFVQFGLVAPAIIATVLHGVFLIGQGYCFKISL